MNFFEYLFVPTILFLFTGTLALWAYVAGWVLLAPRRWGEPEGAPAHEPPEDADGEAVEMEYDERHRDYRPRKMFRYSQSPGVRLRRARERLDDALRRVEEMESYVTSRRYNLNREFSKL